MDLRSILPKSFAILEAMDTAGSISGADWTTVDNAVRAVLCRKIPRRIIEIENRNGAPLSAAAIQNDRWRDKNPHKQAAHVEVSKAKRDGVLVPLSCAECGEAETEAHHENYNRPLEVQWLCRSCHTKLHKAA